MSGAPVYLAGRGLACALGEGVTDCLGALRARDTAPRGFEIAPGVVRSLRPIAPDGWAARDGRGWSELAARLVRGVAAECGADRRGALILATSSFDLGVREFDRDTAHNPATFVADVAAWLQWQGPVHAVSTACTSAVNALLAAQALVGRGECEEALVLGFELGSRLATAGFAALQLLSPTRAQPLGASRDGLVLGEAVAALRVTRAPARWRLRGGANVVDGGDPAGASVDAVAAMARRALAAAGVEAAAIDLVKLQAAGSPGNDAAEIAGLKQVFAALPPLVSLKAALGHTLGASGAAELALLCAALETGDPAAWPAVDYDLDAELSATLAAAPPPAPRHVLAVQLGFGGGHAAVVLEDCEAAA